MITGIIVALPQELDTLSCAGWEQGQTLNGGIFFITEQLLAVCSGAGAKNAQSAAELLINTGATRLISWGCAGGLDAILNPGDLILVNKLIDENGIPMEMDADLSKKIQQRLSASMRVYVGAILETSSPVTLSKDKIQLHKKTGALAIDMETVACARVAKSHGLPFLAIRAIADPVDMDLPEAINHALDEQGNIKLIKLLAFLVLHPAQLPSLIKLGLHFNAAKKNLKIVASQLDSLIFC